ncbi:MULTISPECIES: PAS domain-containing protein [unclassified Sphingomonas]|uniref:PAS domain-containing protein n=1 Tax=unclassified Sphingomonas TaxID=196159 RepID=UPI00226AA91D|nr:MULTISPECIES: PAS domain-containing protein [unclassified Sphingomonas]
MTSFSRPIAQCISDADQRFLSVDQRYADLLMDAPAALIGRHPLEFTHPDDRSVNAALLDRVCHDGTPFSITKRYVRRDGSIQWVNNHISRLSEGGINRLIATCRPLDQPAGQSSVERHWRVAKLLIQGFIAGKAEFGGSLITSPPAELLLLLYTAEMEGRCETMETAAAHMALPPPLAGRWVDAMVHAGLVETELSKLGDGPTALRLTPRALPAIERIMTGLASAADADRDD